MQFVRLLPIVFLTTHLGQCFLIAYESVPRSVADRAVYYVKSTQLDDFSCAYNALFNACNLDRACGVPNRFADYSQFSRISSAYARSEGLNPKGSTSTRNSDDLALNHLRMKNVCNLGFKDARIIPLFDLHARISITGRESKAEQQRMFQREFERQQEAFIDSIKYQFDAAAGLTRVMHFVCTVQDGGTGHAVLVSLVQNSTGRGLYIFDNLNRRISENSEIMRYIHYLSDRFSVSSRGIYQGPQLPERWSSAPKPRVRYYYN